MILRPAQSRDLEEMYHIEEEAFATPWPRKSLAMEVEKNPLAHYLVVEEDLEVVAYGGFWKLADEGHIGNIAVRRNRRGMGYGTVLMEGLLALAKELEIAALTLEVRPSNKEALALYGKFGFYKAGVRKKYYSDTGEDGWILWKKLE